MYKPQTTEFLRKRAVTNFGRTERITGAGWTTMIDVDIDEQQCWTVSVDTKQISATLPNDYESVITSKVMAKVEIGSGNGTSTQIFDASDLAQLTIAGDHVRVSLTLVSSRLLQPPPNGSSYQGIAEPAPAPVGDAALCSCFLSSEFITVTPPGVDFPVTPIFGAPGDLTGTSLLGLVASVPVRVRRVSAFNPDPASTVYLNLRSTGVATDANDAITRLVSVPLPPQTPVVLQFATGVPFANGLVWNTTSDANGGIPSGSARVEIELVRKPSVLCVPIVSPTS